MGGVIFITKPSLFHFLERANTQKSEVFLLRISSGNANISGVVTCNGLKFTEKSPSEKLHFLCLI